jgi:hypothetical protein
VQYVGQRDIITINVPLILKVRDINFFLRVKHNWAFHYAQDNLGVKMVSAPSKHPEKCPSIFFAPDKKITKNNHDFQNQRYIGIFMSQREKERKREREREIKRERESERESKSKCKSESESKSKSEKGKGT